MSRHTKIFLFLYLSALEMFISAFIIQFMTVETNGIYTSLVSLVFLAGSLGTVGFSRWLQKEPTRVQTLFTLFEDRSFQAILSVSLILLVPCMFLARISWSGWSPLIVTLWSVGFLMMVLFPSRSKKIPPGQNGSAFGQISISIAGLFTLYGFLFIPSKFFTIFDGIPWETKFEFIFTGLLIPFVALINLAFFRKAPVLLLLLTILIIKICVTWSLPETGLEIQVYRAEADDFTLVPDYSTVTNPDTQQTMKGPYNDLREFPMEWVNNPSGGIDNSRIELEIAGYARVEDGEKLIFLVQGVQTGNVNLTNLTTQNTFSATVVDGSKELDRNLYNQTPSQDSFAVHGNIIFKKGVQLQFSPIILKKDGSFTSAFESLKIWRTKSGIDLPTQQLYSLEIILNFLNYLMITMVAWGLLEGLWIAFSKHQIAPFDLFLFATGLLCFFITQSITRINQPAYILPIIALIGLLRLAFHPDRSHSIKALLFTIGFIFLLLFLRLDFEHLREVSLFSEGQDNVEYQTLARNIYVKGDFFLLDNPPRAYKVLFPYLVGLLHIFFGQSSAAQLFLNAWCALLSGLFFFRVLQNQKLSPGLAYATSFSFLLTLCLPSFFIFYFRFGLIEPVATLMVFVTMWLASEKKLGSMFIAGLFTVLLRLDYIGITFALITLSTSPILGETKIVMAAFFSWLSRNWKIIISYLCLLSAGPASIIALYFFLVPNYLLNAGDTQQTSIASISEGLARIIIGGSFDELHQRFLTSPLEIVLISLILVMGTLIAFISILYRKGIFQSIDIRWSIILVSFLMVYILVTPTGYSPRFSTPLLPLALTMMAFVYHELKRSGILSGFRNSFR